MRLFSPLGIFFGCWWLGGGDVVGFGGGGGVVSGVTGLVFLGKFLHFLLFTLYFFINFCTFPPVSHSWTAHFHYSSLFGLGHTVDHF